MRPYRIGQVMSLVLLNCYILAYTQRKIIYTGIFKSIPEPVLNCYGGPLAVFACPLGSLQQIIGIHQIPWLILGVFGLVGVLVGRMACGWVCPFGLWQDLLQKIPTGRAAGSRRWLAWAGMLAAAAALVLVLTLVFRVPARELILLGWLPFGLLSLVVIMLGKRGMPSRLWLGGLLGGIGLGVLVWARFGASFGVVAGVTGMALLGLTGRWFAAVTVSMGGFVVMLLGTPIHTTTVVGQLGLAILVAGLGGGLVLVLDLVLGVSRPGHYLKYAYLVVVAILVAWKTGEPWFCKLCPQGTLGAGIPLVLWDPLGGLRDMVGWLYWVKISILLLVLLAAISIKRPFCRLICPIGAIYSLFNKISLLHLTVGEGCSTCRVCAKVCPMDIEVHRDPNQGECIRCLECRSNCRPRSVSVKF